MTKHIIARLTHPSRIRVYKAVAWYRATSR